MKSPSQTANELLRQAHTAQALDLLRENPGDDRCRWLLREFLVGEGFLEEARPGIESCSGQADCEGAICRSILALAAGDPGRAVAEAEQAIRLNPEDPGAFNHLGRALQNAGRSQEAIRTFRKAVRRDPAYAQAWHNLAHTHRAVGDHGRAVEAYEEALKQWPGYRSARFNLGLTWSLLDHPERALAALFPLLETTPDDPDLRVNIGLNLHTLGRFEEAEQAFVEVLQRVPGHALAHAYLGILYNEQLRTDEAIDHLEQSLAGEPQLVEAICELANVREKLNQLDEAQRLIDQALHAAPGHPGVLVDAARIRRRSGNAGEALRMLSSLPLAALPLRQATDAWFELATCQENLGQFDAAFDSFTRANALAAGSIRRQEIDAAAFATRCAAIGSWQDRQGGDLIRSLPPTFEDWERQVCFMIGFPRSGTTLLDTMLDSLPEVSSIEEQPTIETVLRELEQSAGSLWNAPTLPSQAQWRACRDHYRRIAESHGFDPARHRWLVDKLPLRTVYASFMGQLLPEAKFIFSLRHPCDVILSNFQQNYVANEAFVHFDTLESSIGMYEQVMDLWLKARPLLGERVCVVRYEDLVSDPAGTLSGLCEFLTVDYREDMLSEKARLAARGRIQTNSYAQVAQPIYRSSMGRWTNYRRVFLPFRDRLDPLLRAFGYDPLD